jgi:prevent-host-death family protein
MLLAKGSKQDSRLGADEAQAEIRSLPGDRIRSKFDLIKETGMKEVQVSEGIVPLGEFKAQAAKLLKRLADSDEPMVITQNGRPAGVLLSPREFDRLQQRHRFLESIAAGLADAEAGRVIGTQELRERLQAWRAERGR